MKIGFVLVTYNNPPQLLRLTRTLQKLYDDPPIVCHHDFRQCSLDIAQFRGVEFVTPHEKTGWGRWAVVRAALRGIELLYKISQPDWFFLLSAADYPVRNSAEVVSELGKRDIDALIDLRELAESDAQEYPPPANPALAHFVSRGNVALLRRRYAGLHLWIPIIRRGPRLGRLTVSLPFMHPYAPFDESFHCYYGDFWFSGNGRVAERLLSPNQKEIDLQKFYYRRAVPEESYIHTVLGNSPGIRIDCDTKRFAEWNGGGAHPQILDMKDIPAIAASKAYFARKFSGDSDVLDEIDRIIFA